MESQKLGAMDACRLALESLLVPMQTDVAENFQESQLLHGA